METVAKERRPSSVTQRPSVVRRKVRSSQWGFLELIVVLQTAIPAALFLPGMQGVRTWLRAAAYLSGASGLAIPRAIVLAPRTRHPSTSVVLVIVAYLTALLLLSPGRLLPALAEFVLVLCVLAPVVWAPGLVRHPVQLQRVLWLLVLASGINSLVGVLQVYDPDRWMPPALARQITDLNLYRYVGADGRIILRPCGLYDSPGAVSAPGAWAALTGFALFQQERHFFRRLIALACAFLGVAVIYLTLVRTAFVIVLVGVTTYAALLFLRQRSQEATKFLVTVMCTLFGALLFAEVFGGTTIIDRFSTLFQSPPTSIYYQSRGIQLEHALLHDAFEYPLGAGLGSWGMVPAAFGGGLKFAELQFHGWILDGGIPLLVLYSAAVVMAVGHDIRLCLTTRSPTFFRAAACIAAVNTSTLVSVLSFVPFNSQVGTQFWLLTGVLHGAALLEQRRRNCPNPG